MPSFGRVSIALLKHIAREWFVESQTIGPAESQTTSVVKWISSADQAMALAARKSEEPYRKGDTSVLLLLSFLYVASILLSYFTLVAPKKSYVRVWPNDVMGLLDIANRVYQGQIPYLDFHLFHGPLVGLIPALGLSFGFKGGVIFAFQAVAAAALLLLPAVITIARRLTLASAILAFVFVFLLIVVPLGEGYHFEAITWGTFYNRQCWAALIIILLFYVEPRLSGPLGEWIDAIVLSVLVLFEIYSKITFGVVAIGFVVANSIVSKYNRRVSLLSILLIILSAVSIEFTFHFHTAYWRNITEFASRIQPGLIGLHGLLALVLDNAPVILASLGSVFIAKAAGRRSVMDVLFVLGCIVANVLLRVSIGDNVSGKLVALIAVFLCMGELARRSENERLVLTTAPADWRHHLASLTCLLLAFAFVSTEVGNRTLAWASYSTRVVRGSSSTTSLPGAPPALAGFLVLKDKDQSLFDLPIDDKLMPDRRELTAEEYMRTVVEGAILLRSIDHSNQTVFTFDAVDPFTYALNMRPSRHGYPQFWLLPPLTTNPKLLPRPEVVFEDIDLVMVPRLPYDVTQLKNMMVLYGPYLMQNYVQVKESSHWELWQKK